MSDEFPVQGGLKLSFVTSPLLFNAFIDGSFRVVITSVLSCGSELLGASALCWKLSQLLFAALVDDS